MNARKLIAQANTAFADQLTTAIERMRRQADAQDFLLWAAQTAEDYAAGRCGMPVVTIPDETAMAPQPSVRPTEDVHEDFPRILREDTPPPLEPQPLFPEDDRLGNAVDFKWADGQ